MNNHQASTKSNMIFFGPTRFGKTIRIQDYIEQLPKSTGIKMRVPVECIVIPCSPPTVLLWKSMLEDLDRLLQNDASDDTPSTDSVK